MSGRFLLAAALLLAAAVGAQEDAPRLSRRLAGLSLGDRLSRVEKLYPPTGSWTQAREPKQGVIRIHIERSQAQRFPKGAEALWLGLRDRRLVDIQVVYDAEATRQKPVAALVDDVSLEYGEPRRNESRFWWVDGKTVIRVFNAEVSVNGRGAVELRTSEQVLDADLFR